MGRKTFADTFGFTGCWESTEMYCSILVPNQLFKMHKNIPHEMPIKDR